MIDYRSSEGGKKIRKSTGRPPFSATARHTYVDARMDGEEVSNVSENPVHVYTYACGICYAA